MLPRQRCGCIGPIKINRKRQGRAAMPLYELFCMARPALARPDAAQLIRNIAGAVLSRDGVLTDIKSFGDRQLAYTIKRPGQRYEEVTSLPAGIYGAGRVNLSLISDGGQIVTSGVEVATLHPWRPSNVYALLQAFMWQIDFAAPPVRPGRPQAPAQGKGCC